MNKPISRNAHGFTDYTYVPFSMYAPEMFGFKRNKTANLLCKALSATVLASSLVTRAEWGFLPELPFNKHLLIDAVVGSTAVSAPWLFGFAKNKRARNTFLAMGAFSLLAAFLSQPDEEPPAEEKFLEAGVTLPPL